MACYKRFFIIEYQKLKSYKNFITNSNSYFILAIQTLIILIKYSRYILKYYFSLLHIIFQCLLLVEYIVSLSSFKFRDFSKFRDFYNLSLFFSILAYKIAQLLEHKIAKIPIFFYFSIAVGDALTLQIWSVVGIDDLQIRWICSMVAVGLRIQTLQTVYFIG